MTELFFQHYIQCQLNWSGASSDVYTT